jgi:two-component system, chemotaxis family, sensor histidine kinase and response regulator PixL
MAAVKDSQHRGHLERTLDRGLVLVVDDDLDTRAAASELLADMNYWPVTMRNGLEALQYLRMGVEPIALLIDLYMPLMDGEAFCEELDKDPRLARIPRYLISANPDAGQRQKFCGALGFLSKPLLGAALEGVLDQARQLRSR